MKKIKMILASIAVMLAIGGVYASALLTRVDYRPNFANRNATTGVFCDEPVPVSCNDIGNIRCTRLETYVDPNGGPPVIVSVIISKRIDKGPCLEVRHSH
jgi:hypothetical protein